ncbi:MAG: dihydroorotase, partial [Gammaproteobacteria bacterium]
MDELSLIRPDDWHLHVRDDMALAYRERILAAVPTGVDFTPLMTLYLTDNTAPEEIRRAQDSGLI